MSLRTVKDNVSVLLRTKCATTLVLPAMTSQMVIIYIKREIINLFNFLALSNLCQINNI